MSTKIAKKQFAILIGLVITFSAVTGWLIFDSTMIQKKPTQDTSYTPLSIEPTRVIKTIDQTPTQPTLPLYAEVKSKRDVIYINDNNANDAPKIITDPLIDSDILRRHDIQIVPANDDFHKRSIITIPMEKLLDWNRPARLICSDGHITDISPIESINNMDEQTRRKSSTAIIGSNSEDEYYFNGNTLGWAFRRSASQEECSAKFVVFTRKKNDTSVRITYKKSTKTISPSYPSQDITDIRNAIASFASFFEIDSNPNMYWQANWLLSTQKEPDDNIIKTYAREIGFVQDKKVVSLFSSYVKQDMDKEWGADLGGHIGEIRIEDDTTTESWQLFSFSLYEVFGYFRFMLTPDLKATRFGYVELGGS